MRIKALVVASLLVTLSVSADLITPQASAPRILIPVAGDAAGANGTHFRSDITIVNLSDTPQRVLLRWLSRDVPATGDTVPSRLITLGARSGLTSENFTTNVMQQTGIGAIEIIGVADDSGTLDPQAQLHAAARIWTPQPNVAGGEMSQPFPAIIFNNSPVSVRMILGMRRDGDHRLNVGIVNPSTSAHRFRVTVVSSVTGQPSETIDVDVRALSMRQVALDASQGGVAQILIQALTQAATSGWQAWASSIHNITGDAWSQMAFPASAQ